MPLFQIGQCDWCGAEERDTKNLLEVNITIEQDKKKDGISSEHKHVCGECRDRLQVAVDECYAHSKQLKHKGK